MKKTYVNISGRLLADAEGKDWPNLKVAELDPAEDATKGMIAYGLIRQEGAKAPAAAPEIKAPTPQTDTGAVAIVAPTEPPLPTAPEPQPSTVKAPARKGRTTQ